MLLTWRPKALTFLAQISCQTLSGSSKNFFTFLTFPLNCSKVKLCECEEYWIPILKSTLQVSTSTSLMPTPQKLIPLPPRQARVRKVKQLSQSPTCPAKELESLHSKNEASVYQRRILLQLSIL